MPVGTFQFIPITPEAIDIRELNKAIFDELVREGEIEKRMFLRVTKTWRHKPVFDARATLVPEATVSVTTKDQIFIWNELGTKRHFIKPKGKGYPLKFKAKYKRKSRRGVIGSRAGGASGKTVRSMGHWVKGITAGNWGNEIVRRRRRPFTQNVQRTIRKTLVKLQRKKSREGRV